MPQLQQLFEMMPMPNALGFGALAFLVLIGVVVVLVKPAPAMNYEILTDGRMVLDERDEADEVRGIGAQSYPEARVISLESARLRSLYPKGRITGDVALNVQKALDRRNPDTFNFKDMGGDDAA